MPQTPRFDALNGERGLLAAVIAQAVKDLGSTDEETRRDAYRYLTSDLYKHHLELLDLQPDLLPAGVEGELKKMKGQKLTKLTQGQAAEALDSVVKFLAEKRGVTYNEAFAQLQRTRPGLIEGYQAAASDTPSAAVTAEIREIETRGRIIEAVSELRRRRNLPTWNEAVAFVLDNPSSVELDTADLDYLREGVSESEADRIRELKRHIHGSLVLPS